MPIKYIKQIINQDFVYPNNEVSEYDQEIVHDLNENSVSGTVVTLTATTATSTGMTFSISTTWSLNSAEPFIRNSNNLAIYSVHMLAPGQNYYKPWRIVHSRSLNPYTGQTSFSETGATFSVTAAQAGVASFVPGTYYFEVRFIGHRAIYPVMVQRTIGIPPFPVAPTPTPTPTVTPTATPTPTPTSTFSGTTGVTLNVTDTGYIKYDMASGTTYQYIGSTGTVVLTNCLDCDTVNVGIPFADLAAFTITSCGNPCGGGPAPTPTPSASTIYVSTNREICSDFCTTNYLITQPVTTTAASYAALVPGDYIYGLVAGTYWYAYAATSTSTGSGVFRIAEVDSSGYVLSIAQCSGSSCDIL
jgi:hypothetical protein